MSNLVISIFWTYKTLKRSELLIKKIVVHRLVRNAYSATFSGNLKNWEAVYSIYSSQVFGYTIRKIGTQQDKVCQNIEYHETKTKIKTVA